MTTYLNTNTDDFKISGNWEVFAMHLQEKFSQDAQPNLSAAASNKNESVVNSDEMQQIKS